MAYLRKFEREGRRARRTRAKSPAPSRRDSSLPPSPKPPAPRDTVARAAEIVDDALGTVTSHPKSWAAYEALAAAGGRVSAVWGKLRGLWKGADPKVVERNVRRARRAGVDWLTRDRFQSWMSEFLDAASRSADEGMTEESWKAFARLMSFAEGTYARGVRGFAEAMRDPNASDKSLVSACSKLLKAQTEITRIARKMSAAMDGDSGGVASKVSRLLAGGATFLIMKLGVNMLRQYFNFVLHTGFAEQTAWDAYWNRTANYIPNEQARNAFAWIVGAFLPGGGLFSALQAAAGTWIATASRGIAAVASYVAPVLGFLPQWVAEGALYTILMAAAQYRMDLGLGLVAWMFQRAVVENVERVGIRRVLTATPGAYACTRRGACVPGSSPDASDDDERYPTIDECIANCGTPG